MKPLLRLLLAPFVAALIIGALIVGALIVGAQLGLSAWREE